MALLRNTTINDTGFLTLPVGNTAQRPTAIAGTVVQFTTVGIQSWTVPANVTNVEVLVVAGGGAGGWDVGGGGGGGGVVYNSNYAVTPGQSISVTVGGGGTANTSGGGTAPSGGNSIFGNLIALGGGGGGNWSSGIGGNGGSGGGSTSNVAGFGRATQPTSASGGYGNDAGIPANNTGNVNEYSGASGGGGAGGKGGNGISSTWSANHPFIGAGGPGIGFNITGTIQYYAGGGGSASDGTSFWGQGGIGGGGRGGGFNGVANTGGGGGGAGLNGPNGGNVGGNGGSGIVIVRYTESRQANLVAGALRLNSQRGVETYTPDGSWVPLSAPYFTRTIISHGYMLGGYQNEAAWNNVNRISASTDTTINLGDGSIERSFNYQSSGCSKSVTYVFGAGNGHAINSNYVIAYNMRTDQQYNGTFSRTLNYARWNAATIFQEHYIAWSTGGGGSNIDEYNLTTETKTQDIGGFSSTGMWAMSHENYGIFYWENDSRVFQFATRAYFTKIGGQPSNHSQQKSVQSKLTNSYAGNEGSYNGGNSLRRSNMITSTTSGTVGKPRTNCGEENLTVGQDWQYCLGEYNGAQNNGSWKFFYATETGFSGASTMEPKGKGGSSSGACGWRD